MTWSTAVDQVRDQLGDNPKSHLRYRQRVIGKIDGTNKTFKTLDFRRVTDFVSASSPLGVFVNGSLVSVVSDNTDIGEFALTTAPVEGDYVEASFYIQWFLDSELQNFLGAAAQYLGFTEDWTVIPDGLRPAAKFYACKQAMENLALRWTEFLSSTYLMEDALRTEEKKNLEQYQKLADMYWKQAEAAQKNYYTRQGQNLSPNFASLPGVVRRVAPNR